ncbi:MAG: ImmA/IrrE family metallo-endopeptidase, partial [bacterium]|nr:ImmA/IrrE family metallo-endopeptidase [bacterium]
QETIEAFAQTACERQMYLQTTLFPNEKPAFPPKTKVHTLDDAEASATKLRRHWALGAAAIESLAQTIENYGGIIVEYPTDGRTFDGLSGWVNGNFPLIIVNPRVPDDRIRFNLAHELGHLVMDCDSASENEEDLAYRFAEALLVPATVARKELGEKRRALMFEELGVLKRKYGFSMQGWLYRAWHLGIIRESYFKTMRAEFNKKSWKRVEPIPYEGDEKPTRLRQMTLRALSEGIITGEKAEELCPGCTKHIEDLAETERLTFLSPSELLKLPRSQRRALLTQFAKFAEREYRENRDLTDFEAFGEDDLQDE